MSQRFMPEENALAMHLSFQLPVAGIHIFSAFAAALRETRQVTGRNVDTGEKLPDRSQAVWLGALGYMALLDQIGSCFRPRNAAAIQANNSISRALKYFTQLSDSEVNVIYALRNAFAHDFSLYNIHGRNPDLTHRFAVKGGGDGPLITLPRVPWDGDYQNKTDDNLTIVDLELFGDLVEGICVTIVNLANAKQLEIILAGGSDELLSRYAIFKRIP